MKLKAMNRWQVLAGLLASICVLAPAVALAAGSSVKLDTPLIDTANQKSLQRGAKVFVNSCMGCHSAGYQRYSRLATDLGLSEEDVVSNLIFSTDKKGEPAKVGSLMTNNMTKDYAVESFGVQPPDLSLTARSRGIDWIYTYMRSFYIDPERAGVGVNNTVYPGAAMPHVLWQEQGWQKPVYEEKDGKQEFKGFETVTEGSMTADEYDDMIADLVNFMAYLSDPIKNTRHRIGRWVLLFLFGLLAVTYLLKKEYWKDIR